MSTKKVISLIVSIILAAALIAVIWYSNKHTAIPQASSNSVLTAKDPAFPAVKCDISKQCKSNVQALTAQLSIQQSDIRSFTPLPFKLSFVGINPDSANIDFQGVDMFMGSHKIQLEKRPDHSFYGDITLSGHHGKAMTWRAVVTYTLNGQSAEVWFEFPLL